MSGMTLALLRASRRMVDALQKETALARLGALAQLGKAAEDKKAALGQFARAWAERDPDAKASPVEREELRRILSAAEENAVILEAVTSALGDLSAKVRTAATSAMDPGVYSPAGRPSRHVHAASVDDSV
jgi:hypothetical protein